MHRDTQIELTERVLGFVDARSTEMADAVFLNPVDTYTSDEQLARERDVFFRKTPLLYCHSSQVAKPGDYLTDDLAGVPVLVVRGQDGVVRAFMNMCRHRGARLLDGEGHCDRAISCPYHAWTYGLDGALKMVAPAAGFPGIAAADRNLVALPCAERHGFVWVRPTPGPALDQGALLGPMDDEIASYGFDTYLHHDTRRIRKAMNWKLVIDTFMETWHVGVLHKKTVAAIFQPAVNAFDAFGPNGRLIIPRRSIVELRDQPKETWDFLPRTAIVYTVVPNSLIVWQGDHLEVWRAFPGEGTNDCITEASLFIPEPATTESAVRYWNKNMDLLMATVDKEDFPVCEGIQKSCESGAQTHMTFGKNEPALIHFHRELRSRLGLDEEVAG